MRFIKLSPTLSIVVHKIEAIESGKKNTSRVHTATNTFESSLPKDTLIQLLERETDGNDSLIKNLNAVLQAKGEFAG